MINIIGIVRFSGILDTEKEKDLKMIKGKWVDGKELLVDLKVF